MLRPYINNTNVCIIILFQQWYLWYNKKIRCIKWMIQKREDYLMATYHSDECRTKSLALYNKQIKKLNMPFSDIYIKTSFGRTHLIETGNKNGKPLLVFHGGNSTTAWIVRIKIWRILRDFAWDSQRTGKLNLRWNMGGVDYPENSYIWQ